MNYQEFIRRVEGGEKSEDASRQKSDFTDGGSDSALF